MKNNLINYKNFIFGFLILGFFIGIWHAFPMLNIVNDESYFVGGVLRAIQHHTIIPKVDDVPYGTLTYLLSYGVTALWLIILLPFFKFSISALTLFVIQSPQIMYFALRFLSACLAVIVLWLVYKLIKKEIFHIKTQLFILTLLFTNIITIVIFHTGKVWVLSMLLILYSFYFLYKALGQGVEQNDFTPRTYIFLTILFSFLAVSNFPINIFSLITIPILIFHYRKDKKQLFSVAISTFVGLSVFLLLLLFNFAGIKDQLMTVFTDYHPQGANILSILLVFTQSFRVYMEKFICLFPLSILTLCFVFKDKIKNYTLFYISLAYFISYSLVILIVASWVGDFHDLLRYLFPLGFFLIFMIISFNVRFRKVFSGIILVSLIYYGFTLYYLSVPTTYNKAYDWVNTHLGNRQVLIVNQVKELDLVKNKESSLLTNKTACATKCEEIIENNLNSSIHFLVLDKDSSSFDAVNDFKEIYYIEDAPEISNTYILVASFTNTGNVYHSVDYNMGNYFDSTYFRIHNLGKNIYIYRYEK